MGEEYFFGIKLKGVFADEILKLRKTLENKELLKPKQRFFPHITIYPQGFNNEQELIKRFVQKIKSFKVKVEKITIFDHSNTSMKNILHFKIKLNNELIQTQELFVKEFSKIRNKELENIILLYKDALSDEDLKLTRKWGYPYCMNQFRPHITIGAFKDKNKLTEAINISKNIKIPEEIEINEINLFKKNKEENIWEEISSIKLLNSENK